MASPVLVVHERIGTWARHLRPRLSAWPLRLVETRSGLDLEGAVAGAACPLVLIDLATRPGPGLDALDRALCVAPDALTLVLDPEAHPGVPLLAREVGATHVVAGPVTPPAVAGLLARWLPLARRRSDAAGWSATPPEPEPWNWLTPLLNAWPGGQRPPRD